MIRDSKGRRSLGRIAAMIPFLAALAAVPGGTASASFLDITTSSSTLLPGGSLTVSVNFVSTESFLLQATDLAVSYDSTRFSVSNVQLGSLDDASSGFFQTVDLSNPGEVVTSASTGTLGNQVNPGDRGTLETFTLTALAIAPAGGGQILIQSGFGVTVTDVYADANGNAIVLTPPPTNTYNPAIDATVIVPGLATVPEPSSILLMGLGGGMIALTTLRHQKAQRLAPAR